MNHDLLMIQRPPSVRVRDKTFDLILTGDLLRKRTAELAEEISISMRDMNPLVLAVLNGAFIFAADLVRYLDFDPEIHFVKLSSYRGAQSTGVVREVIGMQREELQGRNILVVEDIVDSGKTLGFLRDELTTAGAESVRIASLLLKPGVFHGEFDVDYVGFEIPDRFVVGYGLDYHGYGRSLDGIYQLKEGDE